MGKKEKEENFEGRGDVAQTNFFNILHKKHISQKKFAKDNHITEGALSQWKSRKNMTLDQVEMAAKYLNITVDELYYTESEKKEISFHEKFPEYSPIDAQQIIKIRMLSDCFSHPYSILRTILIIASTFILISCVACAASGVSSILLLFIPICCVIYRIKYKMTEVKTFSINYLDDIYYFIKNPKNKYFVYILLTRLFSLTFSLISFIIFACRWTKYINDFEFIEGINVFLFCFQIIVNLLLILSTQKNFKSFIYDSEISEYNFSFYHLVTTITFFGSTICLLSHGFNTFWLSALLLSISVILSFVGFVLCSKKYSEYKLVYDRKNEEIIDLYETKI